mgnify:CR=1 FL=1
MEEDRITQMEIKLAYLEDFVNDIDKYEPYENLDFVYYCFSKNL